MNPVPESLPLAMLVLATLLSFMAWAVFDEGWTGKRAFFYVSSLALLVIAPELFFVAVVMGLLIVWGFRHHEDWQI